ncbi:MAG: hypothetical protein Q9219_004280 [cf. Caloplaca sp. 3 TL-2023]
MSVPEKCTVLVVGGGPGGSYTAAALAREDTDFLAARGPENYSWNVIRSESDNLMFQHARASGATVFDGVKVSEVNFTPLSPGSDTSSGDCPPISSGRPVSAAWQSKTHGNSGTISFDYIVDASGRAGVLNKYTKGRKYNSGLNNVACWGYWRGTDAYASGTSRANAPYFEALRDESGWAWLIPLHNGTTSVGVVMKQELQVAKKKAMADSPSKNKDFYLSSLKLAPNLSKLIGEGELTTDIKNASDFSYNSSSYGYPYVRIVGDAGCFIDPFYSSGVHLAMVGALSAATTISAAIRGDYEEDVAAKWHSSKIADGYSRFLLVVLSAYKQMRRQDQSILSGVGADNFDEAFAAFQPIIQGTADTTNTVLHSKLDQTIDFCANAFDSFHPEDRAAVLEKMAAAIDETGASENDLNNAQVQSKIDALRESLEPEEKRVLDFIRARKAMRTEDTLHIESFTSDVIDGLAPRLERGNLTLVDAIPQMRSGTAQMIASTRAIYGRNHQPQDIPAENLSHVLYAFANVKPDTGEVYLTDTWSDTDKHYSTDSWNDIGNNVYGCIKQLYLLKKKHRHLKVLLSIGGWTYSSNFANPASTHQGRSTFAKSAVQHVKNLGLDGLDIDWEYPQDDVEAQNFAHLLTQTRKELDAASSHSDHHDHHHTGRFVLTVACPAGAQNYERLHLKSMDRSLDFWNLMAYDYTGSWDTRAGHQANLYLSHHDPASTPFSTRKAVEYYVSHGIRPSKIVLGMPLYGRAFTATSGPGHSFSGTGEGSWENGIWDFKDLPKEGAKECIDKEIGASWSYDEAKRVMVTYDTLAMANVKVDFMKEWGLGGGMWWESSGDKKGNESLIGTVVTGLKHMDRSLNRLAYPESKYDNLRDGMPGE